MDRAQVWERLEAAMADLYAALPGGLSDAEVRDDLLRVQKAVSRTQSWQMTLSRELDRRPGAVEGYPAGRGSAAYQNRTVLRDVNAAKADVDASRVLDDFPQLAAAYAAGDTSAAHIRLALRAIVKIPERLWKPGTRAEADDLLARRAMEFSPQEYRKVVDHLAEVIAPDAMESFDAEAFARRALSFIEAADGMFLLRGVLDPAGAAIVRAQLDKHGQAMLRQARETREAGLGEPERRTGAQLKADALVALCADGGAPAPRCSSPRRSATWRRSGTGCGGR